MNIIPYIYAVLNNYISYEDFINWAYEENIITELGNHEIIDAICHCNYESIDDIDKLHKRLNDYFRDYICNAKPSCLMECTDYKLKMMLIYSNTVNKLLIDFNDINTPNELHKCLKYVFHLPYWYGENWSVFSDLLDLSDYRVIVLFNFEVMKNKMLDASEQFLKIINTEKNSDCIIILT